MLHTLLNIIANIKKIWQGLKEIVNIKSKNYKSWITKRKYGGNKHFTEHFDN